jgi:hypothetical protein
MYLIKSERDPLYETSEYWNTSVQNMAAGQAYRNTGKRIIIYPLSNNNFNTEITSIKYN